MRKIFKLPILILTALSINNVYAATTTEDLTAAPTAKPLPPVKALQPSDLHMKPLADQLELVGSSALPKIHKFLGMTDVNSFNQLLTEHTSRTLSIPASTISIAVNPHLNESNSPLDYTLMHNFLFTVESPAELLRRLDKIVIDLGGGTTDKQAHLKTMLCQTALTITHMKQAIDLIAQTNVIIESLKAGTATSPRTVVEYTTDIESFKRDISVAEALLRSMHPKKPTVFSFNTTTRTRRQKLTGLAKLGNIEIPYASASTETSDPITAWKQPYIINMLNSSSVQEKAVREGRITYTQPQPPAPPAAAVTTDKSTLPEVAKVEDKDKV